MSDRSVVRTLGACVALGLMAVASAQTPPADQSAVQANQAIAARKAVYTLIGNNFTPVGGVLQGRAQFDAAELLKRAERVAFLSNLALDAYPEISKTGNTKASADIWEKRAEFDKKLQEFVEHSNGLVAQLKKDKTNSDAFKAAATAVAGDCKGCHDAFRLK